MARDHPGPRRQALIIEEISRERVLLAGGGRALIMQLAHPLVAAAVAEHSGFPEGALHRLRRTLELSLAMVYGKHGETEAAAARIRSVHERVTGAVEDRSYRADEPRLLQWVNATLIDTTLLIYERFVRRLREEERRRYYEETLPNARLLGITDDAMPRDLDAFRAYMGEMLSGPELRATDAARTLVHGVLRPPLPLVLRPANEWARLMTLALLPERIRVMFDLRAGPTARASLAISSRGLRVLLPLLPRRIREFRAARTAASGGE